MGEKRLVIADGPVRTGLSSGWLMLEVTDAQEVMQSIDLLTAHNIVQGIRLFGDHPEQIMSAVTSCFTPVLAAGGVVQNERGELLVIHRLGVWDLPKGKVDDDESIEEAAIREVKEECGLTEVVLTEHLIDTFHIYERNGTKYLKHTVWFRMTAPVGQAVTPETEEGIEQVKWVKGSEIGSIRENTYPSLIRVFGIAMEG